MPDWNLQLISPDGEIFNLGSLGYASATLEHSYVFPEIREFLMSSTYTQRDFVLSDLQQMLLNESFHRWHGYRLVWGNTPTNGKYSSYPNGSEDDLAWSLHRLINGKDEILLEGRLPYDWWELEEEDRLCLIERKINSEASR